MPALVVVPASAAATMSDLIIERYKYGFNEAGQPVIEMTVKNPDKDALQGEIAIRVSRALQAAQNEYVYKRVASAKGPRSASFQPGKEQRLTIREAPLLKPGMYEAEIRLGNVKEPRSERYDFEVSQAEFNQAKARRGDAGEAHARKGSWLSYDRDRVFALLAGMAALAGIINRRKAKRNNKARKRQPSNPHGQQDDRSE